MKKNTILAFIFLMMTHLVFSGDVIPNPSSSTDKWYSRGVFYELLVRSFKDTNGDKYGDFKGVTQNLDYLKKLGITGIWLMPITPSAEQTNGYDPTDLMSVEETYGTMEDFKELLAEAHKRDIKIILDFVINHVSDQHPYFIDASTNKNSKYRDWFVWKDERPVGKWGSWYWHETPVGYYYSYFVHSKPDLNFRNPEVVQYMKDVMSFWLDMGADGLRFDAVTLLVQNGEGKDKHQPLAFEVYKDLRKFLDKKYPERELFTIAESEPPYNKYMGNGDNEMFKAVFNFKFNNTIIRTVKRGKPYTNKGVSMIDSIVKKYSKDLYNLDGKFFGTLLSNHDAYAGNRPFEQFKGDMGKTKLAGSIYLTLPGIPFIYYGEEIGMDTYTKSKNDKWLRNVMLWDDSHKAGFTKSKYTWNMVNANYKTNNVKSMDKDSNSILNSYRNIIKARTENISLSLGDYQSIKTDKDTVLAYLRSYKDETTLVVHNFDKSKVSVNIPLKGTKLEKAKINPEDLIPTTAKSSKSFTNISVKNLEGYSTVILKLK